MSRVRTEIYEFVAALYDDFYTILVKATMQQEI